LDDFCYYSCLFSSLFSPQFEFLSLVGSKIIYLGLRDVSLPLDGCVEDGLYFIGKLDSIIKPNIINSRYNHLKHSRIGWMRL